MSTVVAHVQAQISVMAARGLAAERIASLLRLSPAMVESELRWLKPAAGKAPEREAMGTTSPSSRVGTVVSS
jgi:predicted transcriptional regulator